MDQRLPTPRGVPMIAPKGRLELFVRKLLTHSPLANEVQFAIAELPHSLRRLEPGDYILREGDRADICPILLSGFAFRHKIAETGGRQIVALKIPGEPLDFQSLYLSTADHNLQALTAVELAIISLPELEKLVTAWPLLARAVLVDILIEASIGREWLLNIGRRNALARLAHFLCELNARLRQMGAPGLDESDVPLTQEQLADMLGLTPVHINRTLRALEDAGAVSRTGRRLRITNLGKLCALADFSDLYLHRGKPSG